MEYTWHTFGTQVEDQDQTQDKDKVWVLVTIENHLVKRKGLKQVERKGLKERFMVIYQIKSFTWINQSRHFKWVSRMVLWRGHFSLCVGACHFLWVNQVWYLEG